MSPDAANVALACMDAFVDGLAAAGVREACVSPGSRSTPIALALARHPNVRVHVHLDERSSAFFALGLAKATDAPVVVACTSGTAAANLFPAVVEAAVARVPLIALTADRPRELLRVGANQTIDQVELYGVYVNDEIRAPVPNDEPSTEEWVLRGCAVTRSSSVPHPGPVHVNLPFREPLVPAIEVPRRRVDAPPVDLPEPIPPADLGPLIDGVRNVERGLVYAGSLRSGGDDVVAIADLLGWPLVAEPHSGARRGAALGGGRLLLGSEAFLDRFPPDVVLQIGAAPTSRAALGLVRRTRRLVILDPDALVADPLRRAAVGVIARPRDLLDALSDADASGTDEWVGAWTEASERACLAVDELLDGWDEPFEGRVARDVASAVAAGGTLCVGSSLPIRDLDEFMRPRDDVRVLANRGASGIDGFVSTALGVSAVSSPTVGLLGDLTFVHDVGALVWNARRGLDVALVVLDNGGGAIFSTLEQRSLAELEELFVTPHGADIGAIVRAAGARHALIERAADIGPAVRTARQTGGVHVVQVRIDPVRDRVRREAVHAAVERAIR